MDAGAISGGAQKEAIKTAAFTGVVVGLIALYDLPESSLVVAAAHAGIVTYMVDRFLPILSLQKAVAIGGAMSLSCGWQHAMKQWTCTKYGVLTAVVAGAAMIARSSRQLKKKEDQ